MGQIKKHEKHNHSNKSVFNNIIKYICTCIFLIRPMLEAGAKISKKIRCLFGGHEKLLLRVTAFNALSDPSIDIGETSVEVVGPNTLGSNPQVEPVSTNLEIFIVKHGENQEMETIGSSVEDSAETELNTLENENFDPMSKKWVVKLQKIERIIVSTLNNYECQNCDKDFLNFEQHLQKMHKMPLILYCKNCNGYKIVQSFDEIESFFELHECNESEGTSAQVIGSNTHVSNSQIEHVPSVSSTSLPKIVKVICKDSKAVLHTTKFKSGGSGKCIQFGEVWLTPNAFETKSGSRQGPL